MGLKDGTVTSRKNSMTYKKEKADKIVSKIKTNTDNQIIIAHNLEVFQLPDIDLNDTEQFKNRIVEYLSICNKNNMKPTVEGLALSFGVNRATIWKWCNNVDSDFLNIESRNILQKTYSFLNSNMIDNAINNNINPVMAIFLMKNNFNYKDQTEVIQTTTTTSDDADRLLDKYDIIDVDID